MKCIYCGSDMQLGGIVTQGVSAMWFPQESLKKSRLSKIIFEGDAPENIWYSDDPEKTEYYHSYKDADHYTIYYHKGAKGFTSPTWYGYPTQEIE